MSSIIKFYSLVVIILNVLVLAWGEKIDKDPEWKRVKLWLQMVGLKANSMDFADAGKTEKEKEELRAEVELAVLRNRMLAMCIFFLASMYLTGHFAARIKQAKED